MNSFGQISASAFGFSNTNSLALASAKFDFTLIKVEAPAEYVPFGSSLSSNRREEAEVGPLHRTARRLAALFEQKAPCVPKLTSAYGKRVSELINKPGVNPSGSHKDGPFAQFVGADGTAIWAAATSGSGALGTCLLALLLARAWHSSDSAAIWVDIVEARKNEIRQAFRQNNIAPEGALISTLQDISREDLRLWDASARSWLLSADQGMQWQLKQLELTTRDLGVPFGGGATTYEKVMLAWKTAADCIESLLCGHPQSIQDQAVLRGISAWHLFPDLLILRGQTIPVRFKDRSFESTAIGTIGLESIYDSPEGGVRWSLALSHLQYYGPPVEVESQLDTPKVTIGQLRLVALGSLFAKWKIHHREYLQTAEWMVNLWSLLCVDDDPSAEQQASHQLNWLYPLIQASKDLLSANSKSPAALSDVKRLVSYGQRRGTAFLGGESGHSEPFFGLCNVHVLAGLGESDDMECGVAFLRSIAAHSRMDPHEGFILSSHWTEVCNSGEQPEFFEHATLAPVSSVPGLEEDKVNIRWLHESLHVKSTDEKIKAAREIREEQVRQARKSNALKRNEFFHTWRTGAERYVPHSQMQSDHGMVGSILEWISPPEMFIPVSFPQQHRQSEAPDGDIPRVKRRRESPELLEFYSHASGAVGTVVYIFEMARGRYYSRKLSIPLPLCRF
jgi:hypothetical protein